MYPPSHPNIQSALERMTAAGTAATSNGPMALGVMPDALLMDGRTLPKPDSSVNELAALLHGHHIGELTLQAPLTAGGWHMLLSLLATSPRRSGSKAARCGRGSRPGGRSRSGHRLRRGPEERSGGGDSSWTSLIDSADGRLAQSPTKGAGVAAGDRPRSRSAARLHEPAPGARRRHRPVHRGPEAGRSAAAEEPRRLRPPALAGRVRRGDDQRRDRDDAAECRRDAGAADEPPPQAGASGHVEDGIDIGGELRSRFNENSWAPSLPRTSPATVARPAGWPRASTRWRPATTSAAPPWRSPRSASR